MQSNIKAKLTEYKGVYFRSRLEVKWCMLFEFLGVRFEYEPEVKRTGNGNYIPDFYFKSLKTWVEIKGKKATGKELDKLKDVCKRTNKSGLIISGYPLVYPNGVEPHLANSFCCYITNKGKSIYLSLDDLYQISGNIKTMYAVGKCSNTSSLVNVIYSEYVRYKNLKPAKAKFKPNKNNFIDDLKKMARVFSTVNDRITNLKQ